MDISNYTGPLTNQGCDELKAAGVVGVIVQAITGTDGQSYTVQQLAMCRRNGLRVQGYIWCFPNQNVLTRLPMFDGFDIEALWLDVEQAKLKVADVDRDLALCDSYMSRDLPRKTGVYGARWFWAQQGWLGLTKWADEGRALWNADYNGIPEVGAGFVPFGGWTTPTISQYAGTSSIGSVHQIDLDVMR